MSKTNLFPDFPKNSTKEWKQKIQFDLNGADYNDSLVWESLEGIKVKPFYDAADLEKQLLGTPSTANDWKVGQSIYVSDAKSANKKALDFLEKGVESICFVMPTEVIELDVLFKNIPLERIPIHLELHFLSFEYINFIKEFFKNSTRKIFLNIDLIGNLTRTGNWFFNRDQDHGILHDIIGLNFDRLFSIDLSLYQNAGANMVQQLAYAMAHAHEYLNHFHANEKSKGEFKKFTFKVSVGSNYFFEISKLKALRMLWKTLATEYGISADCHIIAIPSRRNKTLYEYNANMIRTSMECMAAVLGGADTIFNLSYDALYHKDNEFGNRIALNQLLLLREESHFKEINNAADGAYYIENITFQLAEKALQLFKTIEKGGGFLHQLKNHTIQNKIKESAKKEQNLFDHQKLILVGTNKFENRETRMKHDLELFPFVKTKIRKTLLEPIIEKRLAEVIEQQRLAEE